MKIIFVRHGKDVERYRGGWSSLDLIEQGRIQAERLAEYLFSNRKTLDVRRIISSDLSRTLSTAKYLSDKLEIAVEPEPKLREMNNGDLAGMLHTEALAKYPGVFYNTLSMEEHYPNGESPLEFYDRISRWFFDFLRICDESQGNMIVVTHGGVINIIYHLVRKIDWTNKSKPYKASNCSLHILDTQAMDFELENFVPFD